LWIAFAVGTPIALASGLFILVCAGFAALLESVWMPPHRAYMGIMATSVWTITGIIGLAAGAAGAADPATAIAAVLVVMVVLVLELSHAGRRLAQGEAPPDLDIASAIAALFAAALVASLVVLGRPLLPIDPVLAIGTVVAATILVIAARMLLPLLPDLERIASRLQRFVWAADPVPAGAAIFRALERAVTIATGGFAVFEQRAGVGLAAVLIVALLVWSTR
jgi:hypothetical protein